MDYASKAAELAGKADKRLKSFSLFGGNKYEEAAEMYEKAANQYKLAKACERPTAAGGCCQPPARLRACKLVLRASSAPTERHT